MPEAPHSNISGEGGRLPQCVLQCSTWRVCVCCTEEKAVSADSPARQPHPQLSRLEATSAKTGQRKAAVTNTL